MRKLTLILVPFLVSTPEEKKYDPRRSRFYFIDALMKGPKNLAKIQDYLNTKGYGFCHSTKSCLLGNDKWDDRPPLGSPHIVERDDGLIEVTAAGKKYHEKIKAAAKAKGFTA
jgi:hypothetical protein